MISNSATHLQSFTNTTIAENAGNTTPSTDIATMGVAIATPIVVVIEASIVLQCFTMYCKFYDVLRIFHDDLQVFHAVLQSVSQYFTIVHDVLREWIM